MLDAAETSGVIRAAGTGVNTVKVSALDVPPPPPSVSVETVTGIVAGEATSAVEMAALSPEVLAKVVARALPFHFTTEHGAKVPLPAPEESTPSKNAADPAGALDGTSVVIAGTGRGVVDGATVNAAEVEASAGLATLETVTVAGPGNAVSTAEITAVSCVALTNVVGRGEPFQFTVNPLATKFVPFTVSVIPEALHAGVVFEDEVDAASEVIVGSATAKAMAFDVLALDAGLATATCSVCTAERFAVLSVALSCVGLTKVVGNCVTLLPASVICTLEQGRKFVPVTTTENPGVPAVAPAGETAVIVGTDSVAVETVKEAAAEFTPALDTVIDAVPALAISEAGIVAVNCVALTNAVERTAPFQFTTEPFTKFVPVTVRVKPDGLHEGVLLVEVVDEDSEVIAGARIAKGIPPDVPPPGP